jgi:hypothetical protein
MEKIFNQKSFNYCFWTSLGSRVNTFRCKQSDIVPIICHWFQGHQRYLLQNLLPVSLIPVVHLDLGISQEILERIRNDPNIIFSGLGEDDS